MLVLSRYSGQEIIIGEGKEAIRICLLSTQQNKATIGIQAPKHIPVHRKEIYERIHGK